MQNNNSVPTKKVVQSNNLIRNANWTYAKVPLKLFKALVACIDTSKPLDNNTVLAKKSELVKLLDPGSNSNYSYLKEKIRVLQKTSVKIRNDDKKEVYVSLISVFTWEKDSDFVKIEFTSEIMPYLVELKDRFLSYPVENISHFHSKYGLILYENLLSMYNQYGDNEIIYGVATLRRVTGTEHVYERWESFETTVLRTAIDDINSAGVEILVDYRKVKEGRNIEQVVFQVAKRTTYKETTYQEAVLNATKPKKKTKKEKESDAIAFQEELDELIKSLPL